MREIKEIIEEYELDCTVKNFHGDLVDEDDDFSGKWEEIASEMKLSEKFIHRFRKWLNFGVVCEHQKLSTKFIIDHKKELQSFLGEILENQKLPESFIESFIKKFDFEDIIMNQKVSEKFIKKHKKEIETYCGSGIWEMVFECQKLSESFIRWFINEYPDENDCWREISIYCFLSEKFIEDYKDRVMWRYILKHQDISEKFMEKHQQCIDESVTNWYTIFETRNLSLKFAKKFKNKVDYKTYQYQIKQVNKKKTYHQKLKEIKRYAKKHKLKFSSGYLYAFRNHDAQGKGIFRKNIFYKKGKYYRDWHCDMARSNHNSFGLGIWPEGNTPVKVKVSDWGLAVGRDDGKARVWGFEVI